MREEYLTHNGCLADIVDNGLAKNAKKVLVCILENFSSRPFNFPELEEAAGKVKSQDLKYLVDADVLQGLGENGSNVFELNYNHPVVVSLNGELKDMVEED